MKNDSFAKARIRNPILISAVGIHNNTIPSRNWERSINLAFSFYQVTSDGMSKAYISEAKRFLEIIAYAEEQGADAVIKALVDNIEDFTIELLANCYLRISRLRAMKSDATDMHACRHHMFPASVEAKTFVLDYPCFACEEENVASAKWSDNYGALYRDLYAVFYAEFSADDQFGKSVLEPDDGRWGGLSGRAIDCMVGMGYLNDEMNPVTRLAAEFEELIPYLAPVLYERYGALSLVWDWDTAEAHSLCIKTARAVVEYMKTIGLFVVEEEPEPEPALVLSELPDGSYYDGTYEWEKDGIYWTPLMAPSGMPSEPDPKRLRRVIKTYEAIA